MFIDAFKIERKEVGQILGLLWQKCSDTGYMIRDWREKMLVPLYKKGDSKQPEIYRPIALMSHGRKIIDAAIVLEVRKEYKFLSITTCLQTEDWDRNGDYPSHRAGSAHANHGAARF